MPMAGKRVGPVGFPGHNFLHPVRLTWRTFRTVMLILSVLLVGAMIRASGRRVEGLAESIACDATAESDLDAAAARWTIGSEKDGTIQHLRLHAVSPADQRRAQDVGRERAGRASPRPEAGAGAGPRRAPRAVVVKIGGSRRVSATALAEYVAQLERSAA